MGSGAANSGDDMVVGRTNFSEVRTLLIATNGEEAPDGYDADFILDVSARDDKVLPSTSHGVDAIHAKGTIEFPTGGQIGVIPPGNGIVSQGLNGVVGYVHAASRDVNTESATVAGLLGIGGTTAIGVFGSGTTGVVGYEQTTSRDLAFEAAEMAGVLGRGQIGVSGDGANGPGVHGRGLPGVKGDSSGVPGGPGVHGHGETGLLGEGDGGPGLLASSSSDQAAVLHSVKKAQAWLMPLNIVNPSSLPRSEAGELLVTKLKPPADNPDHVVAELWFCRVGGDSFGAVWIKIA